MVECLQVRMGTWDGSAVVYKIWDLGDTFEPLDSMQQELQAYWRLQKEQASYFCPVMPLPLRNALGEASKSCSSPLLAARHV